MDFRSKSSACGSLAEIAVSSGARAFFPARSLRSIERAVSRPAGFVATPVRGRFFLSPMRFQ